MTEQDRSNFEQTYIERCAARARCYELYKTITKMEELLASYHRIYMHWKKRYEKLDSILAETDGRLTKLPPKLGGKKLTKPPKVKDLTREQIEALAKKLGVDIEFKVESNIP